MGERSETGKKTILRKGRIALVSMYLVLTSLLIQQHAYQVNFSESLIKRAQRHDRLLALQGDAPWAYRVLTPALAEAISTPLLFLGMSEHNAREYAYLSLRWVLIASLLLLFHRFCRRYLAQHWAFAGTLLLVSLHSPSFVHYWFQPSSPLDLLLWLMAVMLTLRGQFRWLPLMVFLGTLNRETAVFIIAIHGVLQLGREPLPRLLVRCTGLGLIWAAVFLGLRTVITPELWSTDKTPWQMLHSNLSGEWLFYALSFLGVWSLLPLLGWRRVPAELRRLALLMVPYLGLLMLYGRIREVRLLLPLAIPLIPASLIVLQQWLRDDQDDQPLTSPSPAPPERR